MEERRGEEERKGDEIKGGREGMGGERREETSLMREISVGKKSLIKKNIVTRLQTLNLKEVRQERGGGRKERKGGEGNTKKERIKEGRKERREAERV